MINKELINPKSIVVVGGSNDKLKAGGSTLEHIITGSFKGDLYVVNAKEDMVQGIKCYRSVDDIPNADLAVISIPAKACKPVMETLIRQKGTKAFIVFSAGFSEESAEGAQMEKEIAQMCNDAGVTLIGPNCSGMIDVYHQCMFTKPIPVMDHKGVDMVSGSGATAAFIMDASMRLGLRFNSVWSVGNAAQVGIDDVLEYLDTSFDPQTSSKVKLLYIETIKNPDKFLKYSASLIRKGCYIAAIKSGTTDSGSRAASSHTGAIANSDSAVEALFKKAGIIRCYSREEMANIAAVLTYPEMKGNKMAIVSHAGGPAVILTDALSKGNIDVPEMPHELGEELKKLLLPGSAVSNPIDILGTGKGIHLKQALEFCIEKFKDINGIAVIYGDSGVSDVTEAYNALYEEIKKSPIPIYPVMPSVTLAGKHMQEFVKKGYPNFTDEVNMARAISAVLYRPRPSDDKMEDLNIDVQRVRKVIDSAKDGYISPKEVTELLEAAGIPNVKEFVSANKNEVIEFAEKVGYPVVAKVVGPVHKSDVGGVVLNIRDKEQLAKEFDRLMQIKDATSVMIQQMLSGTELFIGAKYEPGFGHIVLCGLGGIFVEVLKDVSSGLAPLNFTEAQSMVHSLKAYPIIKGTRGQKGLNEELFTEIIVRLSILLRFATEIKEMDINPLLANEKQVVAVDARIRIEK